MKPLIDKPVVVFGGAGFLGSHVADSLTQRGYQVRVFDVASSPHLIAGQEMIVGDMMDEAAVLKAMDGAGVVYNFAGIADINDAGNRPVDTAKLNVLGNVVLLDAAVKSGVSRFVFASTVYVYSNSGSFYRASKQASERFIESFQERYNLDYTICRYGSLYGRRADERNGIYRLLKQALSEDRITYDGSGEAMREYIHVKDAADASVDILDDEYVNQHVILTGHEKMKVRDLITMIREMLGKKIEVAFTENTDDGHYTITPYAFQPKLGRKLMRKSHIDLGQGVLDTLVEMAEDMGIRDRVKS